MAPKAVLIGLPGSGKSTIGRRLAKSLDLSLLDTDAAIEQTTGRRIADIFATDGERSLGGGAVTTAGVRDALAGHTVIYLEISAAEGVRRTGGNTVRPLLAGGDRNEKFKALMAERVPLYRRVATMRVNTNRRNPGAVGRYIGERLENPAVAKPHRRRRRPSWRRGPTSLNPPPSTEAPPTPAAVAARNTLGHHPPA